MDVKLIRCFIVFVVVSFILGVGSAFNGTTENVDNVNAKEVSTKDVDKKEAENTQSTNSVEKEKITPVTEEEKTFDNQKQIEKASEIKPSENKEEVKNNQSLTPEKRGDEEQKQIVVQENVEQKQEEEQEKVVQKEETKVNEQIIVVEEKKEETKIDAEYETLLKQVEYSTYDECMDIGFEEAIKDPIGILGFSCPYIAYKGKIIGYRLQLDYTNPMEESKEQEEQPVLLFFMRN